MTETLIGVPEVIAVNYESFSNDYGNFYKHKIRMLDGTKCIAITKEASLPKFQQGQECKYHILEHLKDDIKKIKYGEPWAGGDASKGPNTTRSTESDSDRVDSIVRQCCVKAAAVVVAASSQRWQVIAEEMYKWVLRESAPKLDWQETKPDKDDDLPF